MRISGILLLSYACLFCGCKYDPPGESSNAESSEISTEYTIPPVVSGDPSEQATSPEGSMESSVELPSESAVNWYLLLVNPWNALPDDFSVNLIEFDRKHAVDERIYSDLQDMMSAMRADGLSPLICSSYRTNELQQTLYNNEISLYLAKGYTQKAAEAEARKWVAVPGTSEHQTGLAVDIVDVNYQILDEKQEDTPVQQWLIANAYRYGFILRYPNNKSKIAGIYYEPWHYRYVGKEAAKEIYEKGICLEEYLECLTSNQSDFYKGD